MRRFLLPLLLCFLACRSSDNVQKQAVNRSFVIIHATVLVGADQWPEADASVVVRDGKIEVAGNGVDVPLDLPVIDGTGLTVLPGLIDAHGHIDSLGRSLENVSLTGTGSFEEVVDRIRTRAASVPKGEWIQGWGWDQNDWRLKDFPTKELLDRAVPGHPVMVERVDGHAALANSVAIRAAGITAATPDPAGGKILRDTAGNPTGVFIDAATNLVERVIPEPTRAQQKRALIAAARAIVATGLTEVHDAGVGRETIALMKELIDEGRFPIRVYAMLSDDESLLREWFSRGPLIGYGDKLTVRSIKLYADGALGSRGAAMLEPYSDDPGNRGLLVTQPDRLLDVTIRGRKHGFQLNAHAIGDRGVRNVLDAYEQAGVTAEDRARVEHFQVSALEDITRLARMNVIASMQPTHATSDMPWAEDRVGPLRIRGAYAWRKVLAAGGRLAFGSDFPVEEVSPFLGIYAAVTRQDREGHPEGSGWYGEERLNPGDAIRGFTIDAAFAAFEESSRGTIEPGKWADLTVIEANPFKIPVSQLDDIKVRFTIVGGEIVYRSE